MSFRNEPVNIDQRVAAIEEWLRGLNSRVIVEQSEGSLAALAIAKGDLFVSESVGVVKRLGVGADGSVLTANQAGDLGVAWSAATTADDALMLAWLDA